MGKGDKKLLVVGDRVLVKIEEGDERSKVGLYLPATAVDNQAVQGGTVVATGPGVDEFKIGQRITVEIHAGCGQCKRCREGMYTACLNYGMNYGDRNKGHRANGFTTDGGFAEYVRVNADCVIPLPKGLTLFEAMVIGTAGFTAALAIHRLEENHQNPVTHH